MQNIVVKRNGKKEPFNFDKIYAHLKYATDGLKVSPEDIIANFKFRMKPEMHSEEIQKSLIFSAADLIEKDNPDMQYAAARLLLQDYYKRIYGGYRPKFDSKTLKDRIEKGYYDPEIFDYYTPEEIDELAQEIINWENDKKFTYLGLTQIEKKYSIKRNGQPIETPQEIFFLIPLYGFARIENKATRKKLIKTMYEGLANFYIFLPTPDMRGFRTRKRGFTSCAGINPGDSIEGIGNSMRSMIKLVTELSAGIGNNPGNIRGLGADIRNGEEVHTGIIPYVKVFESISLSSTQPNSGRSGAVTNYYPFFHWEIEDILRLKNSKGSDEKSVRHSDHAIVFDQLVYERYMKGESITLFHMNDVPGLYEACGTSEFKKLYEHYEKTVKNVKKIPAETLLFTYYNERYSTNRIYRTNANAMQEHSAWKLPVNTSNLCLEINLPSFPDENIKVYKDGSEKKPITANPEKMNEFVNSLYENGEWYQLYRFLQQGIEDDKNREIVAKFKALIDENEPQVSINFGEIFSCILGGLNIGILPKGIKARREHIKKYMYVLVKFLDEKIDYQEYFGLTPFEKFTKNRRALGISPGNLFYLLARYGYNYDTQEARDLVAEVMEEMLYYGIEASVKIAREKGACKFFKDTKYSDLVFPIDTYNKNIDKLVSPELKLDWDSLKEMVAKYGMRNSTLLTAVPSSNSSRPANMISGINPPKELEYSIDDNDIKIVGLLPDVDKYSEFYEYNKAFNINMIEYMKLIAVIQKFIDQAISLNEYVDFSKYPNRKIPLREAVKIDFFMQKYGIKTIYYVISRSEDHSKNDVLDSGSEEDIGCAGGGCTL